MSIAGTPAGGLKTVGQIVPTNELKFGRKLNALAATIELLSHHIPGGPVVDGKTILLALSVNLMSSVLWKRGKT